jgi:hypothetical protein
MTIVMIVAAMMASAVSAFRVFTRVDGCAGCGAETCADDRAFTPTEFGANGAANRTT